jgi:hypothetical protein
MTDFRRTESVLQLTRLQVWSSRSFLPAACVAVALAVAPIGPLTHGLGPAQDTAAIDSALAADSIPAWLALALDEARPADQCWFIDADGRWTLEQKGEPVAIVVARREAATPERKARMVLGPVLMSGALRPPANDAAATRKTELIRQVLGLSFAQASFAANARGAGGSGAEIVLEPASAVLGVPAPLSSDALDKSLEYASSEPFMALDPRCAPRGTAAPTDAEIERWRGSATAEVSELASRGARLLADARVRASTPAAEANPTDTAKTSADAQAQQLPLLPPQHPLGFVAWAMAVDGQQALKRASGDIKGADADVANLRRVLRMAGATRTAELVAERVPVQSEGFQSWSWSPQSPLDAWDLAASVSKGIDARRRLMERLRELALKHAVLGGFPQEGLDEIEMRFAMLESNLPIGWSMRASDEATISEHLEARLNGSLRQGIDRVQARTVAWEVYAAAWNLSDALPREVVEAREAQQARFEAVLREPLALLRDAEAEEAVLAAIRSTVGSPFQAATLCPGGIMTEREVAQYLGEIKGRIRDSDVSRLQELKGSSFWQGRIDNYIGGMLADMLGPLSSDIAPSRHRVVPLIPFPDASSYYSSSTGRPTFPRLIVR